MALNTHTEFFKFEEEVFEYEGEGNLEGELISALSELNNLGRCMCWFKNS